MQLTLRTDCPSIPFDTNVRRLIRCSVIPEPEDRLIANPMHFVVVLDVSGSMSGRPIDDAKRAVLALLPHLWVDDRLSLVVYASHTERVIDGMPRSGLTHDRLSRTLEGIRAGGGTDMEAGLAAGFAAGSALTGYRSHILVFSDGLPTCGKCDRQALLAWTMRRARLGDSVSTFGLGMYYDEHLLANMAQVNGGGYVYLPATERAVDAVSADVRALRRRSLAGLRLHIHGQAPFEVLGLCRYRMDGELIDPFQALQPVADHAVIDLPPVGYGEPFAITLDVHIRSDHVDLHIAAHLEGAEDDHAVLLSWGRCDQCDISPVDADLVNLAITERRLMGERRALLLMITEGAHAAHRSCRLASAEIGERFADSAAGELASFDAWSQSLEGAMSAEEAKAIHSRTHGRTVRTARWVVPQDDREAEESDPPGSDKGPTDRGHRPSADDQSA